MIFHKKQNKASTNKIDFVKEINFPPFGSRIKERFPSYNLFMNSSTKFPY